MNDPIKDVILEMADKFTCPVCSKVCMEDGLVDHVGVIIAKRPGYTLRYLGTLRICVSCHHAGGRLPSTPQLGTFEKWVFPVIEGDRRAALIDALKSVPTPESVSGYVLPLTLVVDTRLGQEAAELVQHEVKTTISYTNEQDAQGNEVWVRRVDVQHG